MILTALGVVSGVYTIWEIIRKIYEVSETKKDAFHITGHWKSTWEPKSTHEPEWADEELVIKRRFSRLIINNLNNSLGYTYRGTGKIVKCGRFKYVQGKWSSTKSKDDASGSFMLIISSRAVMYGIIAGPNAEDNIAAGAWIVGENEKAISIGKQLFRATHNFDAMYVKSQEELAIAKKNKKRRR